MRYSRSPGSVANGCGTKLAAVRSGFVTARAEAVHVDRRTIVVQVDVTDDAGSLVSRTLQTQAVIEAGGG